MNAKNDVTATDIRDTSAAGLGYNILSLVTLGDGRTYAEVSVDGVVGRAISADHDSALVSAAAQAAHFINDIAVAALAFAAQVRADDADDADDDDDDDVEDDAAEDDAADGGYDVADDAAPDDADDDDADEVWDDDAATLSPVGYSYDLYVETHDARAAAHAARAAHDVENVENAYMAYVKAYAEATNDASVYDTVSFAVVDALYAAYVKAADDDDADDDADADDYRAAIAGFVVAAHDVHQAAAADATWHAVRGDDDDDVRVAILSDGRFSVTAWEGKFRGRVVSADRAEGVERAREQAVRMSANAAAYDAIIAESAVLYGERDRAVWVAERDAIVANDPDAHARTIAKARADAKARATAREQRQRVLDITSDAFAALWVASQASSDADFIYALYSAATRDAAANRDADANRADGAWDDYDADDDDHVIVGDEVDDYVLHANIDQVHVRLDAYDPDALDAYVDPYDRQGRKGRADGDMIGK